MIIAADGEPGGLDFGNWLMLGHQALGEPLTNAASVTYPPAVPLLAVLFTMLFGVVWGTAIFAGLASVVPALGVYISCRKLNVGWPAVPAAILVAATSSVGEAAAWGGLPQLIGLGLAAVILAAAQLTLQDRNLRNATVLAIPLFLLGATSHLIFAQVFVALVALVAVNLVMSPSAFRRGTWMGKDGWFAVAGLSLLPLAALAPMYTRLSVSVGQTFAENVGDSAESGFVSFARAMFAIYRDAPWAWKLALVVTMAMPLLLFSRRAKAEGLLPITIALALSVWIEAIVSGHERFVYIMPVAVGLCLAFWLSWLSSAARPGLWTRIGYVCLGMVVALASVRGMALFPTQQEFYGSTQPPGTVAGLDWLRDHTPSDALFAVAPVNGAPFGWWVQGYGRRGALVGSEDRWLNVPEERARAAEVVTLLSSPDPLDPAVLDHAAELDIDYLLLPWAWGGLEPAELEKFRSTHPELVEFSNSAIVVVRVPPTGG